MFEVALIVLLASGLLVMARRWQNQKPRQLIPLEEGSERRSLSVIAYAGLYTITQPGEIIPLTAFRDLHLIEGGLVLQDNHNQQLHGVDFAHIQWVSAVTFPQDGIAEITIHLEANYRWHVLNLHMPEVDMGILVGLLRQVISASRLNIGRRFTAPIGPIMAKVAEDTLQGKVSLGSEVGLYLLPHILIILQGNIVQAKLDTSSIRRVLSVERVSGKLDSLLHPNTPDGIVRLYSLYESVAFALPQYQELAEEISYLSRCPVEFITQIDKTGKM
jgi:hypothetical protein